MSKKTKTCERVYEGYGGDVRKLQSMLKTMRQVGWISDDSITGRAEKLDTIVITRKGTTNAQLVTAEDNQEVIAVISNGKVVVKEGYEVKIGGED